MLVTLLVIITNLYSKIKTNFELSKKNISVKSSKTKLVIEACMVKCCNYTWRPPNLSELTQIIINIVLTHLGLEVSK